MKTGYIWRRLAFCVVLGVVFGSAGSEAQTRVRAEGKGAPVLRIHQLTGYGPRSLMRSPDSSGSGTRSRNAREWVEMTVQFDTDPEWLDEVTFTYYALLKSRATGDYTLLKGVVTYVDVARGRAHQGVAYIRPAALALSLIHI